MKIAMKDGQILLRDVDSVQFQIIKSFGKMKWNKQTQVLSGQADAELLNRLAGIIKLPMNIESERVRMNKVAQAVDKERLNPNPKPIIDPPIKVKPFAHQIRGYNMALLTLGLVEPIIDVDAKDVRCDVRSKY